LENEKSRFRLNPGGEDNILINAGLDCTEGFDAIHSTKAKAMLEYYTIGELMTTTDETLRLLSLSKAALDTPVTGRSFCGTQFQGLQSYYCSSFSIWSVQVSRLTGLVAYCSVDGSSLHFQLIQKVVDKDKMRHRTPHYICGALLKKEARHSKSFLHRL